MKTYLFGSFSQDYHQEKIFSLLNRIAGSTDASDLVVALYGVRKECVHRGRAIVHKPLMPKDFIAKRGHWAFTHNWPIPEDLPEEFRLIRMQMTTSFSSYPKKERDIYGWEFQYQSFEDHLALLFAHELHHYRRYCLGLHPKEGENKANAWAVQHITELGFQVKARKLKKQFKKKKKRHFWIDPFQAFRNISKDTPILIQHDPRNVYTAQTATVMRPIRTNSKRMVIMTTDGKIWRWPIRWLKPVD